MGTMTIGELKRCPSGAAVSEGEQSDADIGNSPGRDQHHIEHGLAN